MGGMAGKSQALRLDDRGVGVRGVEVPHALLFTGVLGK